MTGNGLGGGRPLGAQARPDAGRHDGWSGAASCPDGQDTCHGYFAYPFENHAWMDEVAIKGSAGTTRSSQSTGATITDDGDERVVTQFEFSD